MGFQEDKENAIFDWIDFILNPMSEEEPPPVIPTPVIPIIWEGEDGTRPIISYIQLHVLTDVSVGTIEKSMANNDGEITLTGYGDLTVSVQGYYTGSNEYLNTINTSVEMEAVMEFLNGKGFVLRNIGEIQSVSEIIDNKAEKRWVMEITLGYGWTNIDTPGYFTNVEYNGEYI